MTIDAENRPFFTAVLLLLVLLGSFVAFRLLPGLFEPLSAQTTDRLFELRAKIDSARPRYDDAVVLVDVDDRSLRQIGTYYLGREEHAEIVRTLARAEVSAQAHDVIFAAPLSPESDAELIAATADAGNVYYGMAVGLAATEPDGAPLEPHVEDVVDRARWELTSVGDPDALYASTRYLPTFPELARAARGIGFLDIRADRDGVYRRTPLLARSAGGMIPAFPLLVVCDYLGVTPDRIEVVPGRTLTLRGARRPGEESARDLVIPIDEHGSMVVNYVGPWGTMAHYPAGTIYEAGHDRFMLMDLRDELSGKLVLLAWVSSGAGDVGPVPGDPIYPLAGLHANVIHTILTEQFLRQLSPMRTLWMVTLPLLAVLYAGSLRLRTLPFLFVALGLALAHALLSAAAFLYAGVIVDIPGPIVAVVASTVLVAAYHYHLESKARAVLRSTFDAYFPPSVVDKVVRSSDDLAAAAQKKEVTVLFSDIKNFTRLTAEMEAGRVRGLLNEYFEKMIEIVFRHEGTLDKFIGDGLMVFFGDPQPQSDQALRCVRAAVEMQLAARELDRRWKARGEMPLEIRIGINTGEAIVGNMGSRRRLSYTALGSAVNLAQRLESSAPVGGILISRRTQEMLAGAVATQEVGPIQVKGIDEPIPVWEVPLETPAPAGRG